MERKRWRRHTWNIFTAIKPRRLPPGTIIVRGPRRSPKSLRIVSRSSNCLRSRRSAGTGKKRRKRISPMAEFLIRFSGRTNRVTNYFSLERQWQNATAPFFYAKNQCSDRAGGGAEKAF